jgi:hypothetical protein
MAMAETKDFRLLFISSSLCLKKNDVSAKKKNRRGKVSAARESLIRVRMASSGQPEAEIIPCFRYWLVENSPVLGETASYVPDDGGLNIEGLAWDPVESALVFGCARRSRTGCLSSSE